MVPRLAVDAANGPVADRGPFCLGCSHPALDVVSHRRYIALVRLRLGDAVAFAERLKPGQILISPRVLTKVENAVTVEPAGEFALKGSTGGLQCGGRFTVQSLKRGYYGNRTER